MQHRLSVLAALFMLASSAVPATAQAEPDLPAPESVDLLLPTPCLYDLGALPAVDVPGRPTRQTPTVNPYQQSFLTAPPLPVGPALASTAPVAWASGGAGHVLEQATPGLSMNGWSAADTHVAVGDDHLVQVANSQLRVSDRNGVRPAVNYDLALFFGALPGCLARDSAHYAMPYHPDRTYAAQPTVFRDPGTSRWLVAASVFTVTAEGKVSGRVELAVSQTTDPTAGYAVYPVSPAAVGRYFHAPKFTVTDDKVVLAWDAYDNNVFVGSEAVALPKAPLLLALPGIGTVFPADPARRMMHPAHQASGGTAAHVAGLASNGTLRFDVIDGPADAALRTTRTLAVTSWTAAPAARQKNGPSLNAGGGVLQSPVFRDGTWWGSTTTGCSVEGSPDRFACVRMWEASVDTAGVPTLRQEFDIAEPGMDLLNPGVVLDADGNLVVALSRTSKKTSPGVIVVGRTAGSPPNTISRPFHASNGAGAFEAGNTWGTYAGAAIAPDGRPWLVQEASAGYGWTTEVLELRPAPFTAWTTPARPVVAPGTAVTSSLVLSSLDGWSGPVTLSIGGAPAGSTASLSATTATVPAGSTVTAATVTVTVAPSQTADFPVTVTACGGGVCQSADVTVLLQQFVLSTTNGVPRLDRGGAGGLTTVTVRSLRGFAGTVSLAVSGGTTDTTATLDRTSVVVPAGGSATAEVTTTVGLNESADEVPFTVQACAGYCRTASVTVYVKNFKLYPNPFSLTAAPGETVTGSVLVYSSNSWTGTVALAVSGAPAGSTATLASSSVTLNTDEAKTVPLTVTMGPTQTTGFIVAVEGCWSYCRTTYVGVDPPPPAVALSADPSELDMTPQSSGTSTITIASVSGYAGTVVLSTSGGPTFGGVNLSPTSVTVAAGSPATATLTVGVGAGQVSDFVIEVTARPPDWSWVRTTSVTVDMTT